MRVGLVLVCAVGCGRVGFDPAGNSAGGAPRDLRYPGVLPAYVVGVAIPALVPTVTGLPTDWGVTPDLPAGLDLDPLDGTIDGTPIDRATRCDMIEDLERRRIDKRD